MYTSNFVTVFFVSASICFLAEGQNRNLCDICDCTPSASQAVSVNCNCRKNKILIFKEEDSEQLSNAQFLNVSGCNFLSFPPTGFPKNKKLRTLEVRQMKLFHMSSGVFPTLSNLMIEDIDELILDGFRGQTTLSNVEIKRSSLSEIEEETFKAVKAINKLSFTDVSIGTIASSAITLGPTATKPTIQFVNCKVEEIQTEGISVFAAMFEITNTTINIMHADAIKVNATDNFNVLRSKFGALISPDSFDVKAGGVNFMDNEFASLPSSLLRTVTSEKKLNFIGNLIHDIDLGGFLLNSKLDKLNFVKNKIICDCSPRKTSILKLKEVFPGILTNETYFDGIVGSNSCKNYGGIYLNEFGRQFLSGSICNDSSTGYTKNPLSSEPTERLLSLLQPASTEATSTTGKGLRPCTVPHAVLILFTSFLFIYA